MTDNEIRDALTNLRVMHKHGYSAPHKPLLILYMLSRYWHFKERIVCYFCFYQQIGEWQGLKNHHPMLFHKAKSYEKGGNDQQYTWVAGRSLAELEKIERNYEVPKGEDLDGCAICHL